MSKSMGRILYLLTVLVAIQIYGLLIYEYGEFYGFDEQINPITIFLTTLAVIGVLGLFGRYRNNQDTKGGYCEHGITDKYRDTHPVCEIKDKELRERSDGDHERFDTRKD
jgi:hypothetical protein